MAKWANSDVLDGTLNAIKNTAVVQMLISAYAVGDTYATVVANKIAQVAMAPTDYTLGSSGSNRTLTTAAKSASASVANASLDTGTATSGTTTTLVNTAKAWTVNAFADKVVKIISGTGAGQSAVITSNTATALTFPAMATAPDATSVYQINNNLRFAFTDGAAKVLWVTEETSELPCASGDTINFPSLVYTNNQPT